MASTLRKIFGIGYLKSEDGVKRRRPRAESETPDETHSSIEDLAPSKPSNPSKASEQRPLPSAKASVSKKQRLDSPEENPYADVVIEHTPEKISLGLDRKFDYDNEHLFHFDSETNSISEIAESDLDSLSEFDTSQEKDKSNIPLCRKVSEEGLPSGRPKSVSDDDFSDLESDRTEEQRLSLLLSYQMRMEKVDRMVKKLLTEFQFHVEVSKIFSSKSYLITLPGSDVSNLPKYLGNATNIECVVRGDSPASWNILIEKEDSEAKHKIREQLLSMKTAIEEFVSTYLQCKRPIEIPKGNSTMTENLKKKRKDVNIPRLKKIRVNRRKYEKKMYDFPDLREILQNLFSLDSERAENSINASVSANNVTILMSDVEENVSQCTCRCAEHGRSDSVKSNDSGLATKQDEKSDSITSSIGDFTLDNSQLTVYSESLEQVLSYGSFDDSNLINTLLQKSAAERISFYVQVHNIKITDSANGKRKKSIKADSEANEEQQREDQDVKVDQTRDQTEDESGELVRSVTFNCSTCAADIADERVLLRHILDQTHCEKLHFLYKTAYIRRCFANGQEIQPSTILNSMTMYRDGNKIVCFGDSKFACTLCFERDIVGESVLMTHCYRPEHVDKRNQLKELLDEQANAEI